MGQATLTEAVQEIPLSSVHCHAWLSQKIISRNAICAGTIILLYVDWCFVFTF